MGHDKLSGIMKTMAQNVGFTGRMTNHSARYTSMNQLIHAGVAPQMVAQVSGHKNPNSVMEYAVANIDQQKAMSAILQNKVKGQNGIACLPTAMPLPSLPAVTSSTAPLSPQLSLPSTSSEMASSSNMTTGTTAVANVTNSQANVSSIFAGAHFHGSVTFNMGKL